jgi:hypothetical protein
MNWVRHIARFFPVAPVSEQPAAGPHKADLPQDPVDWAQKAFGFLADPKQAEILRCAALRVIIVTSRQVGKSTIAALRALYLALTHPNSLILMIGPVGSQAGEILAKAEYFAAELGLPIRSDGVNERSLLLPNGSRLVARPAVANSLRGYSQARLIIIDEAAYVPEGTYRAMAPILATGQGALWVLSTPNGPVGRFSELWHDRANGFTRFSIPAAECPRLSPEFLAAERRLYGDLYFAQEYECQFLSAGVQLLTRTQLTQAVVGQAAEVPYRLREKTRIYVGLDLGKRQDHTAIAAVELRWSYGAKDPATLHTAEHPKLLLSYSTRLPLDTETTRIPRFVRDTLQRYAPAYGEPARTDTLLIDATGQGHTIVELIRKDQLKARIVPITLTGGQVDRQLKDGYHSLPRPDLLNTLKMLFELGNIQLLSTAPGFVDIERELVQFQPSGDQQEHDDLVMAFAMAVWQAAKDCPALLKAAV